MILLAALVLVLFGAGLLLAALVASPRDPLLNDPRPLTCGLCPRRRFKNDAEFFAHRCERVTQ